MNNKSTVLKMNDSVSYKDELIQHHAPSVLTRTRITGYAGGDGMSYLGEKIFEEENQIVLGGALHILASLFGVQPSLPIDSLNTMYGIANTGTTPAIDIPRYVCLWGVGIGGSGEIIKSVHDVKFYEREIFSQVPFRVTDQALSIEEQNKYWFKKQNDDGKTAYYLKTFETTPSIKALWKDGEGDEDGTEVEPGVHNTTRTEPIETFVELILKVTKKDVREWFELNGQIEECRVNSIGLFTGIKGSLGDGAYDYKDVKLFSKLNIPNEMLTLAKDITIVYRIYTS